MTLRYCILLCTLYAGIVQTAPDGTGQRPRPIGHTDLILTLRNKVIDKSLSPNETFGILCELSQQPHTLHRDIGHALHYFAHLPDDQVQQHINRALCQPISFHSYILQIYHNNLYNHRN